MAAPLSRSRIPLAAMSVLLLVAALLLVGAPAARAATFTVDSEADAPDAAPGDGACATASGECTLRAAVQESGANADESDLVVLPAGDYVLTLNGADEDGGATGDLDVLDDLMIEGEGTDSTTIDASVLGDDDGSGVPDRAVHVIGSVDFAVSGVTVIGGEASSGSSDTEQCGDAEDDLDCNGGGIYVQGDRASLTLVDVVVAENFAEFHGGGIAVVGQENAVTFTPPDSGDAEDGTIVDNEAGGDGGGLFVAGSAPDPEGDEPVARTEETAVSITEATFGGNTAGADGGGVFVLGGNDAPVQLTGVVAVDNEAGAAGDGGGPGGLFLSTRDRSPVTLADVLAESNTATTVSGGLFTATASDSPVTLTDVSANGNDGGSGVGGMFNVSSSNEDPATPSPITLLRVTAVGNQAAGGPGGIANLAFQQSPITLTDVSANDNSAGVGPGGMVNRGISDSPVVLSNVTTDGNTTEASVGGMLNQSAVRSPITLNAVSADGNTAGGNIGGMFNAVDTTSPITLTDVTANGNQAGGGVGGMFNQSGFTSSITLTGVTVTGNTAGQDIGGMNNELGLFSQLRLTDVHADGNTALDGAIGGLRNQAGLGDIALTDVSADDNVARNSDPSDDPPTGGTDGNFGGMRNEVTQSGTIGLTDVSADRNTAERIGGGMGNFTQGPGSPVSLTRVTANGNVAAGSGGMRTITGFSDISLVDVSSDRNTASDGLFGGALHSAGRDLLVDSVTANGNTVADPDEPTGGPVGGMALEGVAGIRGTGVTADGNSASGQIGGLVTFLGRNAEGLLSDVSVTDNTAALAAGGMRNSVSERAALELRDSVVSGNTSGIGGGGIINSFICGEQDQSNCPSPDGGASVELTRVTVEGNTTGTDPASGGNGGGILNLDFSGNTQEEERPVVLVRDSTIAGNETQGGGTRFGDGGGIANQAPNIVLSTINTTVSGNRAERAGGGIFNGDARAMPPSGNASAAAAAPEVFDSSERLGSARADLDTSIDLDLPVASASEAVAAVVEQLAGVVDAESLATMEEAVAAAEADMAADRGSALSGSDADAVPQTLQEPEGDGPAAGQQAAEVDRTGPSTLRHVTVNGNEATDGGGLFSSETLTVQATIVANSTGPNCGGEGILSLGFNLEDAADCPFTAQGDQQDTDPQLEALADNGGPTRTHALAFGSPAVDAVDAEACPPPEADQRGVERPLDGDGDDDGTALCDVGAYELAPADLGLTKTAPAEVTVGDNLTYTLTVTNAGPVEATATVVDDLPDGVTFVSASSGCSEADGTVTCDLDALDSGGSATVTITVRASDPGEIVNSATVSAGLPAEDPETGNNTASATTEVNAAPSPTPDPTPGPSPTPTQTPTPGPTPTQTPTPGPSPTQTPTPGPTPNPTPGPAGVDRFAGAGRIETAVEISQAAFGDDEADAVVLARADLFPDALAGTPLAVREGAPLLLTPPDELSPAVAAEIQRVLADGATVYLLGEVAALDASVEQAVTDLGFAPVRYGGANRFDTAAVIADEGLGSPQTVLLATGNDFPDALGAGAAAAEVGGAVLLTADESMPPETAAYLQALPDATLFGVGGQAARAVPASTPLVGVTRIETAIAVAGQFFDEPEVVGVATAFQFPDALAGGVDIARRGGPILLSDAAALPEPLLGYLQGNAGSIDAAFLYGGDDALNPSIATAVDAAID